MTPAAHGFAPIALVIDIRKQQLWQIPDLSCEVPSRRVLEVQASLTNRLFDMKECGNKLDRSDPNSESSYGTPPNHCTREGPDGQSEAFLSIPASLHDSTQDINGGCYIRHNCKRWETR